MTEMRRIMGDRTLESLANRIFELDDLIEKQSKSIEPNVSVKHKTPDEENQNDGETFAFVSAMKNVNTVRKTESDVRKLRDFLQQNGEMRNPEEIPPVQLNVYLARFFMNAKKHDGKDYEPETLKSIQGSINRYLAEKSSDVNIITDKEFKHSRDVLASKRKLLRQCGKGNKVNRADPFTSDEINILYQNNQLGTGNPRALINTMYMNNTMHFGMRSRLEHVNMKWGDVILKSTSAGEEYLEYNERSTKTRTGTTSDTRNFIPKMYEDRGNPRCPVMAYKEYAARRPEAMNNPSAPFYIGVAKKGASSWFVNQPMGKNTIGNLVKNMCDMAGITGSKVNHSARKTAITSLVHAGVPPTLVQQLSGHKNVNSINNYSFASCEQQKTMSSILTNFNKSSREVHSSSGFENTTSSNTTSTISTSNYNMPNSFEVDASENMGRLSQEIVEQTLKEISSYENEVVETTSKSFSNLSHVLPQRCEPLMDITPFPGHSNILTGAHISGNVVINFSNVTLKGKRELELYTVIVNQIKQFLCFLVVMFVISTYYLYRLLEELL